MNPLGEVLVGVVMVVGLVGVVVPVLPGLLLIAVAAVVWGFEVGTGSAWGVVAIMLALLAAGTVGKYLVPGQELAEQDTQPRTWLLATAGAVVGFFVVPVVGLVLGFLLGVWIGKRLETGDSAAASRQTRRLLAGIGRGIVVELSAGFVAVACWVVAVLFVLP
ncbi:DUF456 family protein [Salsipaludibacter albus]|uniref:DUF456 family protein n=1 Tax=Salsipaludibacter albus TaxID=2849650 RepID=UPI001EE47C02|nr:DUF456 family protein [Salsipaludibacter albus]